MPSKSNPTGTDQILTNAVLSSNTGHVYGGSGKEPPDPDKLGCLKYLIGRWSSRKNPLDGYNVMPLPEVETRLEPLDNIILKNFHYFEEMDFGFIGRVPNRGGRFTQNAYGLLYEQRVTIADGPDKGSGIHAENGTWLNFINEPQLVGPYGDPDPDNPPNTITLDGPHSPPRSLSDADKKKRIPKTDPSRMIAKQVSVPHGNSLLALGTCRVIKGRPTIPVISALPVGATMEVLKKYYPAGSATNDDAKNPNINPNWLLQQTLDKTKKIDTTVILSVSTYNGGNIGNIPFEQGHANVSLFETTFWIEFLGKKVLQVQYSQTINIEFPAVAGRIVFPHMTVNTLRPAGYQLSFKKAPEPTGAEVPGLGRTEHPDH